MSKSDFKFFCIALIVIAVIAICIHFSAESIINDVHNSDNYVKHEVFKNEAIN